MLSQKVKKKVNKIGPKKELVQNFDPYVQKWQMTAYSDLPNLFYAYNSVSQMNERVIRYQLNSADILSLFSTSTPVIRIHLAVDPNYIPGQISSLPPFTPLIQGFQENTSPTTPWANTYILDWAPYASPSQLKSGPLVNPAYSGSKDHSMVTKISTQTSNLFVGNWTATPFNDLGLLFEAPSPIIVCRVKHYDFSPSGGVDGNAMKAFIENHNGLTLNVFLASANSHDPEVHPFYFRPIIEISGSDKKTGSLSSIYYEFSSPCPPAC